MGSTPISIYSASSIAAILGMSPYTTQFHAWQRIMEFLKPGFNESKGYILPEFPDNAPIRWGTAFEDAIIKLAEEREGCKIFGQEELYTRKFEGITLSCHIDGEFISPQAVVDENLYNGMTLHEGKSTWSRAFYSIKGEDGIQSI